MTSALRNQEQIFILCPARFALEMPVCSCGCGRLTWVCVPLKCVYSWLSPRPRCSASSRLSAEMLLLSLSVHTTLVPKAVGCLCHPRPCVPHIPLCVCFCFGILFYVRSKHTNGFGITVCCKMIALNSGSQLVGCNPKLGTKPCLLQCAWENFIFNHCSSSEWIIDV